MKKLEKLCIFRTLILALLPGSDYGACHVFRFGFGAWQGGLGFGSAEIHDFFLRRKESVLDGPA